MVVGKGGLLRMRKRVVGLKMASNKSESDKRLKADGWVVVGPSAISFAPGKYPEPKEASPEYISSLKQSWLDATERWV